jgi:hypothetical protein
MRKHPTPESRRIRKFVFSEDQKNNFPDRLANRDPDCGGVNRQQSAARSEAASITEPTAGTGQGESDTIISGGLRGLMVSGSKNRNDELRTTTFMGAVSFGQPAYQSRDCVALPDRRPSFAWSIYQRWPSAEIPEALRLTASRLGRFTRFLTLGSAACSLV